ncbi:hypothetical protein LXT12_16030 [Pelomonas sp. P7]|uniref:Lipoprotein n=1 Tax=Pelomonas caseinilytica TaxID=2906763 RepID=A0ABS8XGX1_9BURK|nr:hypothetical protein [Pelomonas sp. P7]MCE4538762.1 hypothetical protein [Pelomonas sp. P7]
MRTDIQMETRGMKRRSMLASIAALGLSACAGGPVKPGADQQIRSVAILSLLGEEPPYASIGLTVFNNSYRPIKTEGKLAEAIESTIRSRLQTGRPQWQVKPVAEASAIRAVLQDKPALRLKRQTDIGRIESLLPDLAARSEVDAVFVVAALQMDFVGDAGAGVVSRYQREAQLMAATRLALVSRAGVELAGGDGYFNEVLKKVPQGGLAESMVRAVNAAVQQAAQQAGY